MLTREPLVLLVLAVFLMHLGFIPVIAHISLAPLLGQTVRVSVSSAGAQGNGDSFLPAITPDGRYVAFTSAATNLVDNDTNGVTDVFVHDRRTGQTLRASVASDGSQGNDASWQPAITPDGRYVIFVSYSTNLVSGDTNGKQDIFVHDLHTGLTTRESISSSGVQANADSLEPAITPDGRYVAFNTEADNLVSGDSNHAADVFIHDRQAGQTTLLSVTSGGAQGIWDSYSAALSADGSYVVFTSENDLVGDASPDNRHIYVRDRATSQVTRASVDANGNKGDDLSEFASISADGCVVAFTSYATNLVPGDTNARTDVFVYHRQTGQTQRVSVASDGSQSVGAVDLYYEASLSSNGRYVSFYSTATNLVTDDANGVADVFVHDMATGQTVRISVASDGTQANGVSGESYGKPSVADSGCVAFISKATNLVPNDTNGVADIFVHCLWVGQSVYLPLMIR